MPPKLPEAVTKNQALRRMDALELADNLDAIDIGIHGQRRTDQPHKQRFITLHEPFEIYHQGVMSDDQRECAMCFAILAYRRLRTELLEFFG